MTGRRPRKTKKVVTITPEMIEAGATQIVVSDMRDDSDVALAVLVAALELGGYIVKERP
jgi:hypothetical protein